MNVFVLCAGRTASTTFVRSASFIKEYTAGHESNSSKLFQERLSYPDNHIEADNRLSWFLGGVDERYGNDAYYVYMVRDKELIAKSYANRWRLTVSIVKAFGYGILMLPHIGRDKRLDISRFYVDTVDKNIRMFLKDKDKVYFFYLDDPKKSFSGFCDFINVECPKEALDEWDVFHNENESLGPFMVIGKVAKRIFYYFREVF